MTIKILDFLYKAFLFTTIFFVVSHLLGFFPILLYCDSGGDSINDFVIDNSTDRYVNNKEINVPSEDNSGDNFVHSTVELSLVDKVRRRIYWYVSKDKGRYSSYEQFKNVWNKDSKVWSQVKYAFKTDLNKTKLDASIAREISANNNNKLMSDIRKTRELDTQNRLKIYFERFNNRNK